jgi:hypothetical protein
VCIPSKFLGSAECLAAAFTPLDQEQSVLQEDLAWLSPLGHTHLNILGRYQFSSPLAVIEGEIHPLRDPNESTDPDDLNAYTISISALV